MLRSVIIIIGAALCFASCKKNDTLPFDSNARAPLSVEFDNIDGAQNLALNTATYTNASGEGYTVTKLKYYVSNFNFTKTDGTVFTVAQDSSYFLIDESTGENGIEFSVPEGEYSKVSFVLGVDSLRNTMDISKRTGVLDPTGDGADMYWGWNSGYIFFKLEGNSTASADGRFIYHIGGFGGYSSPTINNLKTITLDLAARGIPQVKQGKTANIHLMIDVAKFFDGTNTISIAANPLIMFDPYSTTIADNFTSMFRHDHTEN